MSDVVLHCGDCLEIIPTLPPQSVDAILTDLPYGTTACSWDEVIPFEPMWAVIKHVLKPRGVFVTTASQPFTSRLVCSNLKWFKYEWIWEKSRANGFLDANKKPMKAHENIIVFSTSGHTFNPLGLKRKNKPNKNSGTENVYGKVRHGYTQEITYTNYPNTVLYFASLQDYDHPTQKPVSLYTYLTLTYTNEGDTVLDMCAGSGTSGVAAIQTGRNFIGIEKEPKYFEVMQRRIKQAQMQLRLGI